MPDSLEHWLAVLETRHPRSIDLGLERCGAVFRNMGSPRPAGKIFSIAGTNGKGSTAAYLASLLTADGMTCGAYTSPHIERFNERIRIGGAAVTDDEIVQALNVVETARQGVSLTYFEFTTLAAFYLMHAAGLDAAVLEVGLGGRLDAVNLVDADCAVLTAIGLDHQGYLGHDRESIGFEKAGILRPGRPAVCGDRDPPHSVIRHAGEIGARFCGIGTAFDVRESCGRLDLRVGARHFELSPPPLAGRHQAANLATALVALHCIYEGILDREEVVAAGIAATRLPGRLERYRGDARVLLDVGHNPQAAEAVCEYLASASRGRRICVIAMLGDKDAEAVARCLVPVVHAWRCAGLQGPRGQTGEQLAARIGAQCEAADIRALETVADALALARQEAGPKDTILVFGSFETVAAALRHLHADGVQGSPMLIKS
jgi:dihydrofolate synthase/folylpolyglutamate synthase